MSGLTLAQAETKLASWMDAEDKLATAQSTSHNGRMLTRADLPDIAERINYWDRCVKRLSRGGVSLSRVTIHG